MGAMRTLGQSPRISDLAEQNKIAAYNYPQGVLTQTLRAAAAHQPGILSDIGIGTFVDPASRAASSMVTTDDLIKLVEIDNKEYLYYKAIAPTIAFIRATTCDSEGYATFEDEVMYLDALVIARAVHNHGGIVMMQVQKWSRKPPYTPKRCGSRAIWWTSWWLTLIRPNCTAGRRLTVLFPATLSLMTASKSPCRSTSANWWRARPVRNAQRRGG